jgi:hypothetical protein
MVGFIINNNFFKEHKMKRIISICLLVSVFFFAFTACNKKDAINNTTDNIGISRVTHFPTFTMTGGVTVIPKGKAYTEPGIKAFEGASEIKVTTSGAVDTNTPGVYTLTYTATNKDGYSATAKRTVVVYATDASAEANDLSGSYLRPATGELAIWTKLAPGVYQIANPGGATSGRNLTVIAFNPTGFTVLIPPQISSDGATSSSGSFVYTNGTPPSYKLVFLNPTYGTGTRTFVKQ